MDMVLVTLSLVCCLLLLIVKCFRGWLRLCLRLKLYCLSLSHQQCCLAVDAERGQLVEQFLLQAL